MKILKIIDMAVDRINRNIWHSIFCVIIIATLAVLVNTILVSYNKIVYVKNKTEELIDKPTDDTYVVEWGIADVDYEDLKLIKEQHNSMEEIKGAGMFTYGHTFIKEFMDNEEFQKINQEIIKEDSSLFQENFIMMEMEKKSTNMLLIDDEISDLCKLEVIEGSNVLSQELENGAIPVIAGYNYKDLLNVGDVFNNYYDSYEGEKYQVIGILKEGENWLSDNEIGSDINYCKCLDNYLVVGSCKVLDNSFVSTGYFYVTKEDAKQASAKADNIINSFGYFAESKSITDKLEDSLSEERELLKMYIGTLLFLGSIGIITLSAISILSVIITKKDIAIMYSIGFTLRDMKRVTLWENTLKVVTGAVIGFAISLGYIYVSAMEYEQSMILDIELSFIPVVILAMMLVIAFISVIIPTKILNRYCPSELIGK